MVQTRSQDDSKDKGKEVEGANPLEERMLRLESMMDAHSKEMMKHMAEMTMVMSRSTAHKLREEHSSGERSLPRSSTSTDDRVGYQDHRRDQGQDQDHRRDQQQNQDHRRDNRLDQVRYEPQQQHYGNLTRLGKIDLPRFDGTGIKEWLFKVEEFFGIDFTPADLKVKMVAIHFDSHAATWHHSFMQSGVGLEVLYDWPGYVRLLK
uniref:Uncharacterized protein At2g05030 n=2 Tax=Arabidopsis thaliana TaxID=3702 RepID=Q9SI23_ARATH|nr:hypothetical protein [Arabidopsis thaliana]ABE65428.1 hypothetical protein At2g05030 [Arabidopsis thaliana]